MQDLNLYSYFFCPHPSYSRSSYPRPSSSRSNLFRSTGFSLIELMIVVTIIGILASIAIPSYQNYARRARFAEVISATEVFKTAVSIALQQGITLTELSNDKNGIPPAPSSTKNLASIQVKNGIITSTGTSLLEDATYVLQPNADGSQWSVSGSCLTLGFC